MYEPTWNLLHDKMLEIEARKHRQTGTVVESLMAAPDALFEKMKGCTNERIRALGLSMSVYRKIIRGYSNVSEGRPETIQQRKRLDDMLRMMPGELFDQLKHGNWDFLDKLTPTPAKPLTEVKNMHGTLVAAEYLRPGDMVYINSDGKASKMNQTSAPAIGIVSSVAGPVGAGEPVTVMVTKQVTQMAGLNLGFNLDTTQAQEAFKKLKAAFGEIQKALLASPLKLAIPDELKKKDQGDDASDAMAYALMTKQAIGIKRSENQHAKPEPVIEVIPEAPKGRRRNRVFEDDCE